MMLRSITAPLVRPLVRGVTAPSFGWSPIVLFAAGEQGAWYDPSDLSTLYQDSAGTTPVTALGQPVGLMLDKSKGLVRGPELVTNGAFDSDINGWTAQGTSPTPVWAAGRIHLIQDPGARGVVTAPISTTVGQSYIVSADVEPVVGTAAVAVTNNANGTAAYARNGYSSTVGTRSIFFTATATTTYVLIEQGGANADTYFDNISARTLAGRHAIQATSTARPTLQQDANGKYYLQFDGVDDFLSTAAIDFTGTDKMTVVAGVLADIAASASIGMVVNHHGTGYKSFAMQAPTNTAGQVTCSALGASGGGGAASSGLPSPLLAILGGQVDLTGAITLRRNGALVKSATPAFGGGPFAAAVMAIGRQSDAATRHYKGNLYSLLIRGALSTAAQIAAAERYAAVKTGVTLA